MKHALIRALLTGVLAVTLATSAWAGFDEGWAAYESGDYATALEELLPLAEQGDAGALFILGLMYSKGEGVPHDYVEAMRWYRLAAEQSYSAAQFNLADMYKYGKGATQDYVQAYMWWSVAGANGFEEANLHRDIVSEWMAPADISKAQRLAREWLEAHGE